MGGVIKHHLKLSKAPAHNGRARAHSLAAFSALVFFGFSGFSGFSPVPAADFFGNSTLWMFGSTPPYAIVTPCRSFPSSSSFLIASWMCRGIILLFLLSLLAFPANSKTYTQNILISPCLPSSPASNRKSQDKHDRSTIEKHQLTSAARYSRTAARYTGAPDPTRCA